MNQIWENWIKRWIFPLGNLKTNPTLKIRSQSRFSFPLHFFCSIVEFNKGNSVEKIQDEPRKIKFEREQTPQKKSKTKDHHSLFMSLNFVTLKTRRGASRQLR